MSTTPSKHRRRLLPWVAAVGLGFAPPPVAAQHGLPAPGPPLHELLQSADAVAVATVETVEPGRIRLRDAMALEGRVPERFEVKRAPSRPPPLGPGDRTLLLLRGARPPFVLAGEPSDTIRLAGAEMEARWTEALLALLRERDDPEAVARVYLSWIDEGPETLRGLGVRALVRPDPAWEPLPEAVFLERASAAVDPARPLEARRASAMLAMLRPPSAARLAASVPQPPGRADAVVTGFGLRGAALHRLHEGEAAMRRALRHPESGIRAAGLRILASSGGVFGLETFPEVSRLASADADPGVRREAERALRALGHGG